mmetsp:Transcript_10437/g.8973  ORF Transcript_10437/g.8973 Transcript_10437/m.8973 type:complete len:80 (+) Transcript_10437:424-663(+)
MGNCYRKIGDFPEAIQKLQKACDLEKENASAHNNLGLAYFEMNTTESYEAALERFNYAAKKEPENPIYLTNIALAHYHL